MWEILLNPDRPIWNPSDQYGGMIGKPIIYQIIHKLCYFSTINPKISRKLRYYTAEQLDQAMDPKKS